MGFGVKSLHETGAGVFDLLVTKYKLNFLVEVKDGNKFPSQRTLTPSQVQFNFDWQGMKCVVTNDEDCIRFRESVDAIGKAIQQAGIVMEINGNQEEQYKPRLY